MMRPLLPEVRIANSSVEILPLKNPLSPKNHFSANEWRKMFGFDDAQTEEGFLNFISQCQITTLGMLYEVKSLSSGLDIAFMFAFVNSRRKPGTVGLHGGGWEPSLVRGRLFLQSYRLMAQYLADLGLKVHTSVSLSDPNTIKFVKACGFRAYYYGSKRVYMRYAP